MDFFLTQSGIHQISTKPMSTLCQPKKLEEQLEKLEKCVKLLDLLPTKDDNEREDDDNEEESDEEDPDPYMHYKLCGENYDCCERFGDCKYWDWEAKKDVVIKTRKNKYYLHMFNKTVKYDEYWEYDSEEEAQEDIETRNPNRVSWKLGFYGESGEENICIAKHDRYNFSEDKAQKETCSLCDDMEALEVA